MSWERRMLEEEQKTQALLEELSYSQEQRRADELFHGDAALDEEWQAQQQPSPFGWLLGSPYHRRLGGQIYAYLWFIGICLALGLLGFGLKTWTTWQRKTAQQRLIQQLGNPHGATSNGTASGGP
jgi:hypothetical protein